LSNSPSDLIDVLQALLPVALRRRRLPERAGMPPAERGGLAPPGREAAQVVRLRPCGSPWRSPSAWRPSPDLGCPNPAPACAHTPAPSASRRACVWRTPPARAPTPRGSGWSSIGRGVGFAYMTVSLANAALLNPLRVLSASRRGHVPFPTARRKLLPISTSAAETPVRPNRSIFPKLSLPAFRCLVYSSIPLSAILMISWNRAFHES
jgi:hypothetical protein